MNRLKVGIVVLGVGVLLVMLAVFGRTEIREPIIVKVEASYTAEFEKPDVLAREVDNVFIGLVQVVRGTHYIGGSSIPSTLYEVEVIESWKGDARGTVLVNQDSGLNSKRNTVYLTNGDKLLEEGKGYLFATNNQGKWQTVIPVFGDVPIKDDQHRSRLREKFREILPRASQSSES